MPGDGMTIGFASTTVLGSPARECATCAALRRERDALRERLDRANAENAALRREIEGREKLC